MLAATVPEGGTTGDSAAGDTLVPGQNKKGQPLKKREWMLPPSYPTPPLQEPVWMCPTCILGFPGPLPAASPLTR